jgi:NAD(P)-dependent dehydrogenase (short-subunit alcohol dehydrogenase family)
MFAEAGDVVYGLDIHPTVPEGVTYVECNVGDRASVDAAVARCAEHGRIDVLANVAGVVQFGRFETITDAEWDRVHAVDLKGPFFLTQILLPLVANGGQIINITSATSRVATAGVAPYAAFKGGLEVLTRYMAKEFGERGIRANSIAPGAIRTELGGGLNDAFEAMLAGQTALGRVGEPEEIGGVVASLLSSENGWINAQNIEVAGGYII